jgi:hypothetical protein
MLARTGREKLVLLPDKVVATIETLHARIRERFGHCGLANVCAELCRIAREDTERARNIARGYVGLRVLVFVLLAGGIAAFAWVVSVIDLGKTAAAARSDNVYSILQGIDAAANLTLITGAAILFLIKLEERLKRRKALAALHELRSIVHVIDMHQLSKDPSKFIVGGNTPSSPPLLLDEFQMTRYLDYCSEMVSLTSKVAVLFGQTLEDPAVGDVVSDIERVSAGLAQKIWQKITVLQVLRSAADAPAATASDSETTST